MGVDRFFPPLPGRRPPQRASPRAWGLLARLDARPLAARAAADVAVLVRKAGATLRLLPKDRECRGRGLPGGRGWSTAEF